MSILAASAFVFGIHLATWHEDKLRQYQDFNPGIYALHKPTKLVFGAYRNSRSVGEKDHISAWAGRLFETENYSVLGANFRLHATAGFVTGYELPIRPLLTFGPTMDLGQYGAISVGVIPKVTPKGTWAAHLSYQFPSF